MDQAYDWMASDMGSKLGGYLDTLRAMYDPQTQALLEQEENMQHAAEVYAQTATATDKQISDYELSRKHIRNAHNLRMHPPPTKRPRSEGSSAPHTGEQTALADSPH